MVNFAGPIAEAEHGLMRLAVWIKHPQIDAVVSCPVAHQNVVLSKLSSRPLTPGPTVPVRGKTQDFGQ